MFNNGKPLSSAQIGMKVIGVSSELPPNLRGVGYIIGIAGNMLAVSTSPPPKPYVNQLDRINIQGWYAHRFDLVTSATKRNLPDWW